MQISKVQFHPARLPCLFTGRDRNNRKPRGASLLEITAENIGFNRPCNNLFKSRAFCPPIAQNLFAGYIIDQIIAIIIFDTILIALIVISVLEGLTSQSMSFLGILGHLSKNPPVWVVFAGLLIVALAIELPVYLTKLVTFSAYSAAPVALFSMGIVIYNTPILAQLKFAVAISSFKVILQPLVFMIIAGGLLHQSAEMLKPGLMVAVGPSGTMVLAFASAYNIDPKPLAPVVVLSFLISILLLCLTLLL